MQDSSRLSLSMPVRIKHRTVSQTERKHGPARGRNSLIPPPTSHVAFCPSVRSRHVRVQQDDELLKEFYR